jgi:restriction system protein
MALWLVRSGGHGEYEPRFLQEQRIYFTWEDLHDDLTDAKSPDEMFQRMQATYSDCSENTVTNWSRQAWAFFKRMEPSDWVVMPSKLKPALHFAEITSQPQFAAHAESRFRHWRTVKWVALDIPRTNFDQDLPYSFGAFMTVCGISRNNAEARVKEMSQNGWKSTLKSITSLPAADDAAPVTYDIEEAARDSIAKLITARFKGHGLARLVEAVLKAQGYTTYLSAEGPDKGVDILAAPGALGFGKPRVCVQVKSGDTPVDLPTLNQLIGTMQNVHADQGLLVAWAGVKGSVDKERPAQFFRVRVWDQNDIIENVLQHYDQLPDELRAELPLKRLWAVALPPEG